MKYFLVILCLSKLSSSCAQTDFYDLLKVDYDRLRKEEKNDSALVSAKEMNAWALKNETDSSLRYAVSLRYLGDSYCALSLNDSAIFSYNLSLTTFKKGNFIDSLEYYIILSELANLNKEMGAFAEALPLFIEIVEIKKNELQENPLEYATALVSLGNLYRRISNLNLAESLYLQAKEIRRMALGERHLDYAGILNNLGMLYSDKEDYNLAESYYRQALQIRKDSLGLCNIVVSNSLNNLGILFLEKGDYKLAEPYLIQALDIKKDIIGYLHPDYATGLHNLGSFYSITGDLENAELMLLKGLTIRVKVLGKTHPDCATSHFNLGGVYLDKGDYKMAELHYKAALEIESKVFGSDNPDYARTLYLLADLYRQIGDYRNAESIFRKSMDILKNKLSENSIYYAECVNNLGILYYQIGDYKSAEKLLKQSLEIDMKSRGEENISTANSKNNLGLLYKEIGDFKLSEMYFKSAMEITKIALGSEHPSVARILNNLGVLSLAIGNKKLAEYYHRQALYVFSRALGEDHPDYILAENSYAIFLNKIKSERDAFNIFEKNFSKKLRQITNDFEWLSENQKEAYWKKESEFYDNLSWFANEVFEKVPESVGLNYNAALVTKSKMLEAKISSENYYREVDELREELAYRRRLLAKMESEGSTEKGKLDKLRHESDSLDKLLTLSWPEYAQQKKNLSITWDQVQQNLDKGEAAIEFVRFKNEDDSLYYYNALVLRKGDENPTLVKLCMEENLQSITPKMGYSAYYPLVWEPLEKALVGIKTIYYAPTGELYNVPFHAIYSPKGKGDEIMSAKTDKRGVVLESEHVITENNPEFLMDRYSLHQLTSTRYLAMGLKQKSKEPIGNTIAMVGGVNYDYLPGSTANANKNKKDKKASRSGAFASGKLNYLEGTKTEVEQINSQVTTAKWQTKLIENNEAIEENITKLEAKEAKGILHLATHGYAFPEYDFSDTTISKNSLQYSYRYSINPMVRSGIILSGGNWAWAGSDTLSKLGAEQNGILTALEVSQLNLKKTKLVVLSACETGLGKIEGSEGTFGLKRGFKLAGVEQMIVSLWSVPDKETMELMTLFYSDLTKTLNPVNSFEKAQKEMRNKYPTEPEKWAGFVLVR